MKLQCLVIPFIWKLCFYYWPTFFRLLQDDLDKLVKWTEKWQLLFNFGKCNCVHIGHGNMDKEYKMRDAVLGVWQVPG